MLWYSNGTDTKQDLNKEVGVQYADSSSTNWSCISIGNGDIRIQDLNHKPWHTHTKTILILL